MPYARSSGARIYWEQEGQGDPLLMIMGLGFSMAMWQNLRPMLARQFCCILCDNRGVGKSQLPLLPLSMAAMARDACAVLDAAGIESANVLGLSMGGMIAQEIALTCPARVRKLVLGCTNCGGRESMRADPEVYRALSPVNFVSRERRLAAIVPFIYDASTPRDRIERDLAVVRRHPPHILGYLAQLGAIVAWRSYHRLPQLQNQTLVIHGENDRLIPVVNAHILASRLPNCTLEILPQAGHIFPSDQPERTYRCLMEFLTVN
jgi:3-oxoadipate enol-lactonase